jgi:hypothetical protein
VYTPCMTMSPENLKGGTTVPQYLQPGRRVHAPKWLKPGQVPDHYPLSRSQVYVLLNHGLIKSRTLRRPGNVRGTRLVLVESIEQFIESCPSK